MIGFSNSNLYIVPWETVWQWRRNKSRKDWRKRKSRYKMCAKKTKNGTQFSSEIRPIYPIIIQYQQWKPRERSEKSQCLFVNPLINILKYFMSDAGWIIFRSLLKLLYTFSHNKFQLVLVKSIETKT